MTRMSRRLWHSRGRAAGVLLFALVLTGCRIPQDMEGTLENVKGGYLDVGITENPPWVVETDAGPAGVEVEMVREFARQLDAEVRWHWGTEGSLVSALQAFQLDMAIGGLEEKSWLRKAIAMSSVFFEATETVGFPPGMPVPASLEGVRVAVNPVNDLGAHLEQKGALPLRVEPMPRDMPVAAPLWWLRAHGFTPGPWRLGKRRHVWLLPNGENAWILEVDRHLGKYTDLGQRLRQAEGEP